MITSVKDGKDCSQGGCYSIKVSSNLDFYHDFHLHQAINWSASVSTACFHCTKFLLLEARLKALEQVSNWYEDGISRENKNKFAK